MTTGTASALAVPRSHRRRRFEVLVVCTANLCRSPAVEAVLRAAVSPGASGWEVVSAGTRAPDGRPAHPDTVAVLADRGLALPPDWQSRRLTPDDVARADLVLTATREHRGATVALHPAAAARVFTLRQFTRLLLAGAAESGGLQEPAETGEHPGQRLLRTAQAGRGLGAPPERPDADDLADPIGRPRWAFERMADDVTTEVGRIVGVLTVGS